MRLHYQYTAFPGFPDVTEYSRRRARSAATLSLLFAAVLFLGIVFLLAPAVFGYAAPISMILGGAGGIAYLCTFYQRSTKKTIDLMCAAHRASLLGSLRRPSSASSNPPIGGGSNYSNKRTCERPEA